MSDKKTLTGSIALTRLIHVKTMKKGKSGDVRCLVIPIDANALEIRSYENKEGKMVEEISIPVRILYNPETDTKTKQNGFVAKSVPSEVYKNKKDDEEFMKAQQQILGNIKDWSAEAKVPLNNDVGEKDTYDEEDDLPF